MCKSHRLLNQFKILSKKQREGDSIANIFRKGYEQGGNHITQNLDEAKLTGTHLPTLSTLPTDGVATGTKMRMEQRHPRDRDAWHQHRHLFYRRETEGYSGPGQSCGSLIGL